LSVTERERKRVSEREKKVKHTENEQKPRSDGKTLQSLCVLISHKIVETYRNQLAPKFSKGK
jgi:hypothetical protein